MPQSIIGRAAGVEFQRGGAVFDGTGSSKEGFLTLLELSEGETAAIGALHSDGATQRRIESLGLFVGRRLCLIARAPFSGPLLVEDVGSGARVMIARDLAQCIELTDDSRNQS